MKRILLIAAAALSLTACGQTLSTADIGAPAPAPLAKTTIDDSALLTAWKSHDAFQDALNLYMDAKPSFIGTPGAKRIADINDAVTQALTAAETAAAAGSTEDYLTALANAKLAYAQLRSALAALKGK